jgi:hypothetical protein
MRPLVLLNAFSRLIGEKCSRYLQVELVGKIIVPVVSLMGESLEKGTRLEEVYKPGKRPVMGRPDGGI